MSELFPRHICSYFCQPPHVHAIEMTHPKYTPISEESIQESLDACHLMGILPRLRIITFRQLFEHHNHSLESAYWTDCADPEGEKDYYLCLVEIN